jgi:hypothetical protein
VTLATLAGLEGLHPGGPEDFHGLTDAHVEAGYLVGRTCGTGHAQTDPTAVGLELTSGLVEIAAEDPAKLGTRTA